MAEVKNAFIKSKMNKDLDSRLLPSGEYRDGQNIQVSKSEGEDVGALENALGNLLAETTSGVNDVDGVDFSVLSGLDSGTLKSIGVYADTNTSNIFVFLTDYDEPSTGITYSASANNYIYSYNVLNGDVTKMVEGPFLNFSKSSPIHGINVLENLLFFTDNRNQPRKINVDLVDNGAYYTSEDLISVAKYNPYQAIDLYYQAPELGNQYASSYQDVTSLKLPDGVTDNPFYDSSWPGDPDYLEDKFVTFSYRFKFTDGEYSIMAPFTQAAFVPKQDGYFLQDDSTPAISDEENAYRSTVVRFMENKINNVKLFVPLPFSGDVLNKKLGVEAIDILYKESDSLAVKVLDTVLEKTIASDSDDNYYEYDYQSRKPYKTLPESEIIRVYDKVPVRAFGQEVISNRIVYSNFQDKHTPPKTLDYDVAVTPKYDFNINGSKTIQTTSSVEYPSHTVKQNRTYQVGFVLSDRYGRQSTTILSPVSSIVKTDQNIDYGGSTYYHPYAPDPALLDPAQANNIDSWPGDSIKVLINQGIDAKKINTNTGEPGIYEPYLLEDGSLNPNYNPLGWYSYKVVVKQTQQEYYNVYLPGILDGYPEYGANQSPPDRENTIAHITLIGDNINKVPRDLTEVGPEQKQYGSGVQLFGRVTPERTVVPNINKPYYPQNNSQDVVTIAEQDYLFTDSNSNPPYGTVYQSDSDPYIARLAQNKVSALTPTVGSPPPPIGSLQPNGTPASTYNILLGVFETAPVESLLDIFWETSSSGLVSDFNAAAGASGNSDGWESLEFTQDEATSQGQNATSTPFSPRIESTTLDGGVPIVNSSVELVSVLDGGNNNITSNWTLVSLGKTDGYTYDRYNLQVENPMYYSPNPFLNAFTFNFSTTDQDTGNVFSMSFVGTLSNVGPTISIDIPQSTLSPERDNQQSIANLSGVNGTIVADKTTANLSYTILSQNPSTPALELRSDNKIYETSGNASGSYTFTSQVKDSGGLTDTVESRIVFGKEQINESFGSAKNKTLISGLESAGVYWSSNYNNCVSSGPFPQSMDNDTEGRSAYSSLVLDSDGLVNESIQERSQNSSYRDTDENGNTGETYLWKNINYKPQYWSGQTSDDQSLTNGTAYLKLDFEFVSWPSNDVGFANSSGASAEPEESGSAESNGKQYGVGWVAYLQYKSNAQNSEWEQAYDVEGQAIHFGGSQANISNPNVDFKLSGALTNSSQAQGYPNSGGSYPLDNDRSVEFKDVAQSTAAWSDSNSLLGSGAKLSKVFAFGKDQSYENFEDKFGEYRLLVKYPQSLRNSYGIVNSGITAPLPTQNQTLLNNSFFVRNGSMLVNSNIKVNISFGDFYYSSDNSESFAYFVSEEGSADANQALNLPINSTVVYAKEWASKYVTQFYTDPGLSNLWQPTFSGDRDWFSYSSTSSSNRNSIDGSENSYTSGLNSENIEQDLTDQNINESNRRWAARFDSNGKKIKTTAIPSAGNVSNA